MTGVQTCALPISVKGCPPVCCVASRLISCFRVPQNIHNECIYDEEGMGEEREGGKAIEADVREGSKEIEKGRHRDRG